jgi:membrane protein
MARLRDLTATLRKSGAWRFALRLNREIEEDDLLVWASALAYSWLFAIFPFLIFMLALAPYAPRHITNKVEAPLFSAIDRLPPAAATMLHQNVTNVMQRTHTGLLSIGILITIWAASGGMHMTLSAMDQIYELRQHRPFYKQRLLAILLTIVIAFLVLLVLLLIPIGDSVTRILEKHTLLNFSSGLWWAWTMARYALGVVLIFIVLAIFYHFGPAVKQPFRAVSPGSVFTFVCWLGFGVIFRVYVNHWGKFDRTYGTVGGVAILLLFFYIDAVVLLIGAEINSELDFDRGVERGSNDFTQTRHDVLEAAAVKS